MTTEERIILSTKEFKPKSQKFTLIDPNIGDTSTRLFSFITKTGHEFKIIAFSKQISIQTPLETTLVFAINLPDNICFSTTEVQPSDFPLRTYVPNTETKIEVIKQCLKSVESNILALNLKTNEALYVYRNSLTLMINSERQLRREINLLSEIKIVINSKFPSEKIKINKENIPPNLKVLLPFLNEWAISDDFDRREKIKKSSRKELQKITELVEPKINSLNSFLDSFENKPLTPEATLLGNLAELVMEIRERK